MPPASTSAIQSIMSVAVIIVNWNSGAFLRACLRNLCRQTMLPEQIFVLDNASTDDSLHGIDGFDRVTLIALNENIGFAAANNLVLKRCTTPFVVLLNPDAFPRTDWIEKMLDAARVNPGAAAFGSRQLCFERPGTIDGVGDCYHISGLIWRNRHGHRQSRKDGQGREIFSPCAAAAMYRRTALAAVGGFDERYFCYAEDVDLGFRLRLAGHRAHYVPDAVVYHIGSWTTGGQHSDFSVYHGHRNIVWTFIKNMPGFLFWLLLPLHLVANLVSILVFIAYGQGRVIIRSKMDAVKELPQMVRTRKDVQHDRVATIRKIWNVLDKRLIPQKKGKCLK